jgi:hypothetical protein
MAVSYLVRLKPNQLVELFAGSAARQLLRKQSVFEFSLCLSRACLGKQIAFTFKWLFVRRYLDNLKNDWASFYASEIATP